MPAASPLPAPAALMPMPAPAPVPVPAAPPPAPAMPVGRGDRPLGVTIVAVLDVLGGAVTVLAGMALAVGGSVFSAVLLGPLLGAFGALAFTLLGLLLMAMGALFAVAGWGLWEAKDWAWGLEVALVLLGLLLSLATVLGGTGIVGLVLNGFLLWYFTRDGVKRWFGRAA